MTAAAARRRETWWQLVRYGVIGGLVTLLYALVYAALTRFGHLHPQFANFAGYGAAVAAGYVLHSRVTFRDHGARDRGTQLRFAVASLASYALNAFWTWAAIDRLHLPTLAPLVPISTVTPLVVFALNRAWVFR